MGGERCGPSCCSLPYRWSTAFAPRLSVFRSSTSTSTLDGDDGYVDIGTYIIYYKVLTIHNGDQCPEDDILLTAERGKKRILWTGIAAHVFLFLFCLVFQGIYTVPEISMVGKTEDQLTRAGVNYEVGLADYREVRRRGEEERRGSARCNEKKYLSLSCPCSVCFDGAMLYMVYKS